MKIIEFTGIPGSGKSTVLPVLHYYLKTNGYHVYNSNDIIRSIDLGYFRNKSLRLLFSPLLNLLPKKIYTNMYICSKTRQKYQINYILNNIDFIRYVVKLACSRPIPQSHKALILYRFIYLAELYQIALETLGNNSILIFDEGYVHKVVSFFISNEEKETKFTEVDKYLSFIPHIDLLVSVRANQDLCNKRIIKRKLPRRLEGKTDIEISDYLSRSNAIINYTIKYLSNKNISIIEINNDYKKFKKDIILKQLKMSSQII